MSLVLKLDTIDSSIIDKVGGKAARLGDLLKQGFSVPNGFVITVDSFGLFSKLNPNLSADASPDTLIFPTEVASEYAELVDENTKYAVRSSGIAEDLADHSFAGLYETYLNVVGSNAVKKAIVNCWLSAYSYRVTDYATKIRSSDKPSMAVLVQEMVDADSAGVAFSINPMTGDLDEVVINAVKGLGESLVSGNSTADEWRIKEGNATHGVQVDDAITSPQALQIADLAKKVQAHYGMPQDIEWAIQKGELRLLQARPITSINQAVKWQPKAKGLWLKNFRLGEWLGNPVTPLFESWLLQDLDNQLWFNFKTRVKAPAPKPYHIIENGWYYASGNFVPKGLIDGIRLAFTYIIPSLLFRPRRLAILIPPIAFWGMKLYEKEWREEIAPKNAEVIQHYTEKYESASSVELYDLLSDLCLSLGDMFYSSVCVGGSAWKPELELAKYYRSKVEKLTGENYQVLLQGLGTMTAKPYTHAITSLDWHFPTLGEDEDFGSMESNYRLNSTIKAKREELEHKISSLLAAKPRQLKKFRKLLKNAQDAALVREEQLFEFTKAWPIMRIAFTRLGTHLIDIGCIDQPDDIYFLLKDELKQAINSKGMHLQQLVTERRATWNQQNKLNPPMTLGQLPSFMKGVFTAFEVPKSQLTEISKLLVQGQPGSAGRIVGKVKVLLDLSEADKLLPGEILVTTVTNPSWTVLFSKAAGVITDYGSVMAHASLVAREYGIPAVVGTGNATSLLHDGQLVVLNGNEGTVLLAS